MRTHSATPNQYEHNRRLDRDKTIKDLEEKLRHKDMVIEAEKR